MKEAALTRREREIMDIVHRSGRATAADVRSALPDPPHPAAVRTLLRILEGKGHLRHVKEGARHVYLPTLPRAAAQRGALRHVLSTFFEGSRAAAVAALLDDKDEPLSAAERAELEHVVARLRAEGR